MDAADGKLAALRRHHAQHPHPDAVRDPAFASGNPFFDPHDLVQVRYEMLRRVREEGRSVTGTAVAFGVSRPACSKLAAAARSAPGAQALRDGGRRPRGEPRGGPLAQLGCARPDRGGALRDRRSPAERGAGAREAKGGAPPAGLNPAASSATLARTYEALRAGAVGTLAAGTPRGLAVLRGAGMVAWMAACPPDRPTWRVERPASAPPGSPPGIGREFVGMLTEMALGARRERAR